MKAGKVVLVPVAAIEQHGPHLPLDADVVCCDGVARAAARLVQLVPDDVLVMPPIDNGYTAHVMDFPGGIAHACEMETAVYMHFDEDNVHKDKIADGDIEFNKLKSDFHCTGIFGFGPVSLTSWTASYCESGVPGAATLGTKEKGRRGVEEAPSQLARWLNEFKTRPSPPRGDHHAVTPTMPMPWGQPERPTGAGDVHG